MISDLKASLTAAARLSKPAYEVQALHLALLEGLELPGQAFRQVINLIRAQKNLYSIGPESKADLASSSFTKIRSNPEKKGYQYLFLSYFARFRPYSQKKRILSSALNWVREGPVDKSSLKMGKMMLYFNFLFFVFCVLYGWFPACNNVCCLFYIYNAQLQMSKSFFFVM